MKVDHNIKNLILQKVTGLSIEQLFLKWEKLKLNKIQNEKYSNYISRLNSGEPIEYITENVNFYGFDFFVDKRALVPRDDTEIMIEKVLEEAFEVLIDVWTWSSCIAISVLQSIWTVGCSPLKAFVIDISKEALEVSKINIEKHNLKDRIVQIHWYLLEKNPLSPLSEAINGKNIVITANLPYIKNWDYQNMDKETVEFEPDLALYWGERTWFELYEKLIHQVLKLKDQVDKIVLFIEIGFDQKEICVNFLNNLNLKFEIFKDWGWIDRCVKIEF